MVALDPAAAALVGAGGRKLTPTRPSLVPATKPKPCSYSPLGSRHTERSASLVRVRVRVRAS